MTTYQKILNVYAMMRDKMASKMSKYDIANEFVDWNKYSRGDLVIHDDELYMCVSDFSGGSWPENTSSWFIKSNLDQAIKEIISDEVSEGISVASEFLFRASGVAGEFEPGHAYAYGDLVFHNGLLFMCKEAFSGIEWPVNAGQYFTESTIEDALETKASTYYVDEAIRSHSSGQTIVYHDIGSGDSSSSGVESLLLLDNAINVVPNYTNINLEIPQAASGMSRSFKVVFSDVSDPLYIGLGNFTDEGQSISFFSEGGTFPEIMNQTGTFIYSFNEFTENKFLVELDQCVAIAQE